ncbi:polysaccharide biosynthesis/export family protein [Larkinella bovis]|uniref:Polysaccharide biosynthesis/export family protein n=1 Tax=Larkinella bovis TaxID=683041 RepID=A0ABW0IJD8_9BACT
MNLRILYARRGFWFAVFCVSLTGCISSKELVLYQKSKNGKDAIAVAPKYIPTIKAGDILSVQVGSLSQEAAALFNPYATINAMGAIQNSSTNPLPSVTGYQVNEEGQIELPLIGKVIVQGLTNTQAARQIRQKLLGYLKEPTVNVRNLSFQISVTGEVSRPSLFTITNEHITLPEALGLAGDITIYGQRKNILVIREENEQRTFNHIDLTKRDVFQSPYYYLHPNDIIYVEPGKARIANADRTYLLIPIILSALSVIAIIVTR